MFENPRRGRQASKTFDNKSSENSRSQMVFRTDILKLTLGSLTYNSGELTSKRLRTDFYTFANWPERRLRNDRRQNDSLANWPVTPDSIFYRRMAKKKKAKKSDAFWREFGNLVTLRSLCKSGMSTFIQPWNCLTCCVWKSKCNHVYSCTFMLWSHAVTSFWEN